jgi:NitT/TauT family transport system substrate-binding protein
MKRRTALGTLGAIAAAGAPRLIRAQTAGTIRVYAQASDPSGVLYYAQDLGLFEKHGLSVAITVSNDSSLAVSSVVSNSVDIGYTNIVSIEQAYRKGLPVVMVAPAAVNDYRHPTSWIVVATDSPIKTPRDLEGKTLGTSPLRALGDLSTDAWVEQHGGDSSKIKWLEIPYVSIGPAIQQGRIDGGFLLEPFVTSIRATTRKLGWPYESVGKHFLGAAFFASQAWATANPDLVQRFAAAIAEAAVWGNRPQNHPKSARILEKYAHVDAATLAGIERAVYAETLTAADVQPTIDFGARNKFWDASFPASDVIVHA